MSNNNFTVQTGLVAGNTVIDSVTGSITIGNTTINGTTGDITTSGNLTVGNTSIASGGTSNMAPLASPALTGTPTAPTAALSTNTTQIATTAFVLANAPAAYSLPIATASVLGGVKQGNNVTIDAGGILSVAAPVTSLTFAAITSKPSTLAGYGITDGAAAAPVQSVFGRSGAVVLNSSDVTTALTFTPISGSSPSITNPTITNYTETLYAPAAGSAFTVSLANGTQQKFSTNNNTTITLPASAAGKAYTLMVAYGGAHTITWSGGSTIKWAGGTAPVATSVNGKIDIYVFVCDGTNTYGADGGRNY